MNIDLVSLLLAGLNQLIPQYADDIIAQSFVIGWFVVLLLMVRGAINFVFKEVSK